MCILLCCTALCLTAIDLQLETWDPSLVSHRERSIKSADADNVLLNHLLDNLISAGCLQHEQTEIIKSERTARTRCAKLLDFVHSEGKRAFDKLCDALQNFGTANKKDLVDSMRQTAGKFLKEQCLL